MNSPPANQEVGKARRFCQNPPICARGIQGCRTRFLKFRRRSMPQWDFRFFVISSYLTRTNARTVGLVLTIFNHFHLFPSGPLAQSAEGGRNGLLLCIAEQTRVADFDHAVLGGGSARGWGRASMRPDPVRTQSHRCAVMPSNQLVV